MNPYVITVEYVVPPLAGATAQISKNFPGQKNKIEVDISVPIYFIYNELSSKEGKGENNYQRNQSRRR